jgi:glycerate-2-kinase
MARAAVAAVGDRAAGGVVIVPHGGVGACGGGVEVLSGAHPIPDAAGAAATGRLLECVRRAGPDVLMLALLSGGASALLAAPAEGLTLADVGAVTAAVLASGADIGALNTVRKHCSLVLGGGLARAAASAAGLLALVLSDVVGDDPAVIASGPAVADPTTFADAVAVLAHHLPPFAVPAAVGEHLARGAAGERTETVKPGDPVLARSRTVVIGGNALAVDGAARAAAARGYATDVLLAPIVGDARAAGLVIGARVLAAPPDRPAAVIAGGETTVRVVAGGRGGRCQHLALAAALTIAGRDAVVLAGGTDGIDGPTDAAGACVDGTTVARARAQGFAATAALDATDSHPLLAATGDLVRVSATGTNVADVVVALRGAR